MHHLRTDGLMTNSNMDINVKNKTKAEKQNCCYWSREIFWSFPVKRKITAIQNHTLLMKSYCLCYWIIIYEYFLILCYSRINSNYQVFSDSFSNISHYYSSYSSFLHQPLKWLPTFPRMPFYKLSGLQDAALTNHIKISF